VIIFHNFCRRTLINIRMIHKQILSINQVNHSGSLLSYLWYLKKFSLVLLQFLWFLDIHEHRLKEYSGQVILVRKEVSFKEFSSDKYYLQYNKTKGNILLRKITQTKLFSTENSFEREFRKPILHTQHTLSLKWI